MFEIQEHPRDWVVWLFKNRKIDKKNRFNLPTAWQELFTPWSEIYIFRNGKALICSIQKPEHEDMIFMKEIIDNHWRINIGTTLANFNLSIEQEISVMWRGRYIIIYPTEESFQEALKKSDNLVTQYGIEVAKIL